MKTIGNALWFVLCGVWLGIAYLIAGLLACITIIGIPFGIQSFKLAGYVMWPFGRELVESPGHRFSKGVMNIVWIVIGGLWLAIGHVLFGVRAVHHDPGHPVRAEELLDGAPGAVPVRLLGRAQGLSRDRTRHRSARADRPGRSGLQVEQRVHHVGQLALGVEGIVAAAPPRTSTRPPR